MPEIIRYLQFPVLFGEEAVAVRRYIFALLALYGKNACRYLCCSVNVSETPAVLFKNSAVAAEAAMCSASCGKIILAGNGGVQANWNISCSLKQCR